MTLTWTSAIESSPYAMAGAAIGVAYFVLLFLSVRMHAAGASFFQVIPLYALRLAGTAGAFWYFVQQGAMETLLALAGFMVARAVTQRFVGRAARWM